jgi:lipid-binding SYLF domain-containing protein
MNRIRAVFFAVCGLSLALSPPSASAQKKFPKAIERSETAAKIVELLAVLPDTGLPREVIDRAEAVGVFPKVERQSALFMEVTQGYGVICARREDGWTAPAFYQFGGGGFGFEKEDEYSLIFLFMTKDAVAAFEKGGVQLKGERSAMAGPVGNISDEQMKELEGAHVLAYVFGGRLEGIAFKDSFWKNFMLDPDNNINKPLYGMKGREVLAGKKVETATLPAGITVYQEALRKYYGRRSGVSPE